MILQFAGSAVAIALLVGLCWALGFRDVPVLADARQAERIADDTLTGFRAAHVALDRQGRGALLKGHDGRLVALRAVGDRWLVRELGPVGTQDGRVALPREPGGGTISLDLGCRPAWL